MRKLAFALIIFLAILLTILAVACAPKQAPPSVSQSNNTVEIKNFAFNPPAITIKKGQTITWTNNDSASHTITSTGNFDSGVIAPGGQWSFTFNQTGTFDYICTIHPTMKGTVVVSSD